MKIYWVLCASLLVYQAASANGSANDHYSPRPGQTEAQWVRDPFTPSRQMYEIVGTQSGMARGAYGFVPSLEAERIPQMKLRGLINPDDKEFIALLEVKGWARLWCEKAMNLISIRHSRKMRFESVR
nr:hypothetical protein [Methylomarinum sp. Ch1-1]MDP4521732.1 hypothetical protein [Methylomarinum sp. Ch1-1]